MTSLSLIQLFAEAHERWPDIEFRVVSPLSVFGTPEVEYKISNTLEWKKLKSRTIEGIEKEIKEYITL